MGLGLPIHHLVDVQSYRVFTFPVLERIAERVPAAPVNVMAQFSP